MFSLESISRRRLLFVLAAGATAACARATRTTAPRTEHLADIEARVGGRVGVFALDTATGSTVAHRENERFLMCSTFKWVLVAAVLSRGHRDARIDAMARAAIVVSDNDAANALLDEVGGPAGLTEFIRAQGDPITRLDRNEPALNDGTAGDDRDTTSPRAMAALMQKLLGSNALPAAERAQLFAWMRECRTGRERLRAGLPADWIVGDKTGTGDDGTVNDVAIAIPPRRAPLLIACYIMGARAPRAALNAAHAEVAAIVRRTLSPA